MNDGQICEMQYRRDQFLISIFQKYPQLDVDEIFEVLKDLREQVVQFFARQDPENAEQFQPWSFVRVLENQLVEDGENQMMIDAQNIHRDSTVVDLKM